jgi:hypothetical protein
MTTDGFTDDVPQVTLVTGNLFGTPPPCIGCHQAIDTDGDYWALVDGPPCRGRQVLAAAHAVDEVTGHDDLCAEALRVDWELVIADYAAGVLELGSDAGGPRFFARGLALHAATAVEVLAEDGSWLPGRFEYDTRHHPWRPLMSYPLGGWQHPMAQLELPIGAVIRCTR